MRVQRAQRVRGSSPIAVHRVVEASAVVAAALLSLALAIALAPGLDGLAACSAVAAAFALAFVASDVFSGLVHWSFDRHFDERTPYLGPNFVRPFREHHGDPLSITRHDFVELNGNTCLAVVPPLAVTGWWVGPAVSGPGAVFGTAFVLFLAVWTVLTNQFHQWAHQPRPPRVVQWLQRHRVLLAPEHHALHHRPPFDRHFCITSGIANPLLDRVHFFAALEAVLAGSRSRTGPLPR